MIFTPKFSFEFQKEKAKKTILYLNEQEILSNYPQSLKLDSVNGKLILYFVISDSIDINSISSKDINNMRDLERRLNDELFPNQIILIEISNKYFQSLNIIRK